MKNRRLAAATTGIVAMVLVAGACGSSKNRSASLPSDNTFGLSEFTVIPPKNTLHSGSVTLTANNLGGETHELVIVRAASVDAITKMSDGSVDEGKIAKADKVGEIPDLKAGAHASKTFELSAGTYVAFCNIVDKMMGSSSSTMDGSGMATGTGHVHFAEGMHVTFTVS